MLVVNSNNKTQALSSRYTKGESQTKLQKLPQAQKGVIKGCKAGMHCTVFQAGLSLSGSDAFIIQCQSLQQGTDTALTHSWNKTVHACTDTA